MQKQIKTLGYGAEIFTRRPENLIQNNSTRRLAENRGSPYKFAYSRTALKYGLRAAGIGNGESILVPGFICESAIESLSALDITPRYYPVDVTLQPVWKALDELADHSIRALMVVHYFGQPQQIDECLDFCHKHSIILIEDNAHGFGGKLNGHLLGTFGSIGFSSPRKSFPVQNGAYLYLSDSFTLDTSSLHLKPYNTSLSQKGFKERLKNFPPVEMLLSQRRKYKEYLRRRGAAPPYGSQEYFRDPPVRSDYGMDEGNDIYIKNQDMERLGEKRRHIYELWYSWAVSKGLSPVFPELYPEAVPLIFPAFSASAEESIKWYERGHRLGIDIHSWPTLPRTIVKKNGEEMRLWERLVCFPIHQEMDIGSLKKRIALL